MRRTPDATLTEIVRLRRLRLTHKEICRTLSVSHGVVQRALHLRAPELVGPPRRPRGSSWDAKVSTPARLSAPFHQDEFKHWTGQDAPPVREQVALPGSGLRPLTQFELMTGRRAR